MGLLKFIMGGSGVPEISPAQLAEKLRSSNPPRLLDVRGTDEFAIAKLAGATLIPLGELSRRAGEVEAWKSDEVVVYCHGGVRSLRGAGILKSLGFTNVASLAGGIDRWSVEADPKVPRY
jgi:adenylyltransferase/sulfurtransferase